MPSLVGQDPQYLVPAMKAYVTGQRKHAIMQALLSGVADAELNDMALYYARQAPARAQTPPVGDPAAGKAASAACAGCHGEQGVSANPIWPSLAGQDARYLADALRAYKDGSRDEATMKAFVAALDERTINDLASYYASLAPARPTLPANSQGGPANREPVLVRNGLVAGLDERTINDIASYFASLTPAQPSQRSGAQTATARHEPVVVRNGLVAGLDERAIRNVASYYASLRPEQPASGKSAPQRRAPALVSTAAHADGSSVGGIISFRKDDPSRRVEDNNAICLACHERGDRTYWNGSTHETRAIACTDCHTVMRPISRKAALKTEYELGTCFQCHKDRRAQIFRSAHMPLREGKITCSNCHNPHGSATEALLRENSINDNCYKCHAEKRGPFLFEHAPVRENCLSCHDPHGSNTEYMLKVSRPRLCAECHGFGHGSVFSGPNAVESFARSCQNCHTAIHGSNSPSGALLQR
jgi:DmsE family decaheme c-type cytochrome